MVARGSGVAGVPVEELRAAVALARLHGDGDGLAWPPDVWERVWSMLTGLQQSVVYKHVLLGLSYTQIAGALGITRESVTAAYRRALDRMRHAVPPP